jgi:hypothetical protein
VEAVVHQPLGDVAFLDPSGLELPQVEDHLVRHSSVLARVEHVVVLFEPRLDVVGVEDGVACRVGDASRAQHPDVAVRDEQDARTAPWRRRHRRDRLRATDRDDRVTRQVRRQMLRHSDRTHAGAAAPVRNRERLVQVQVADVSANRRRAGQADLGVHVGAVHVHLAAVLMDDGAHVDDGVFEHAVRRGIGNHQRRQIGTVLLRLGAEVGDVHVAMRIGADHDNAVAGHDRTGRVGAVGRRRNEHHVAVAFAAILVVGADHQETGELALRAGIGLERHGRESGNVAQRRLELAAHLLVAAGLVGWRKRVHPRELLPGDGIHLARGVELHRARAERNHRRVEADVAPLEALHVAHHRRLGMMRIEDRVRQVGRRALQGLRDHGPRPGDERRDVVRRLLPRHAGKHRRDPLHLFRRRRLVERDADGAVGRIAEVEPGLGCRRS